MSEHPYVPHAVRLRREKHRTGMGPVGKANDWMATHLAILFGIAWTIWVFFIVPLVAYFLPQNIQNHIFFFSSGWIQLFALPLMIYVGNKLQRSSDAQSDAQQIALTHIATTGDDMKTLLAQNTELTREVQSLTAEIHRLVVRQSTEPQPPGSAGTGRKSPKSRM